MTEERSRVVESLETAARILEAASAGHEVRAALRDGLLGVEYHSDTLAKELAKDPASPRAFEPALRGRAERVEANLHNLLVTAWELLTLSDELGTTPPAGNAREGAARRGHGGNRARVRPVVGAGGDRLTFGR